MREDDPTIDDDVATALEGLRRTRDVSLKDLINEALRRGLQDMKRSTNRRERFSAHAVGLGQVRIGSLDNISEALAITESECFK
jgi:hypothetical protein